MERTFTARGMPMTEEVRERAEQKLEHLEHLEPRALRTDLTFVAEHHPRPTGVTRVEASLHVPRAVFHASAEGSDPIAALDRTVEKLERQVRDAHGKRRAAQRRDRRLRAAEGLGVPGAEAPEAPVSLDLGQDGDGA